MRASETLLRAASLERGVSVDGVVNQTVPFHLTSVERQHLNVRLANLPMDILLDPCLQDVFGDVEVMTEHAFQLANIREKFKTSGLHLILAFMENSLR
jgi:hypothetical protein